MLFDFRADWVIKMTEDEKFIEKIEGIIANYSSEHRFSYYTETNKPTEDRFKDCLGCAVIELQRFIRDKGEGDVVIILRNVSVPEMFNNDYDSVATMYIDNGIWDKIYGEEE